jgi:hypothetical protein
MRPQRSTAEFQEAAVAAEKEMCEAVEWPRPSVCRSFHHHTIDPHLWAKLLMGVGEQQPKTKNSMTTRRRRRRRRRRRKQIFATCR